MAYLSHLNRQPPYGRGMPRPYQYPTTHLPAGGHRGPPLHSDCPTSCSDSSPSQPLVFGPSSAPPDPSGSAATTNTSCAPVYGIPRSPAYPAVGAARERPDPCSLPAPFLTTTACGIPSPGSSRRAPTHCGGRMQSALQSTPRLRLAAGAACRTTPHPLPTTTPPMA